MMQTHRISGVKVYCFFVLRHSGIHLFGHKTDYKLSGDMMTEDEKEDMRGQEVTYPAYQH